jgi:mRNA-degrading endonuclease RelE of RelBE toxin-antitoxin system
MRPVYTKHFLRSYRKLPERVQKQFKKQLGYLREDPQHPSLNLEKVDKARGIWAIRVTRGYRAAFIMEDDLYIFLQIREHNKVLKK